MTEPLHIQLIDLEPHHCRYPIGESPFTFCGLKKRAGSSYCAVHHLQCTEVWVRKPRKELVRA